MAEPFRHRDRIRYQDVDRALRLTPLGLLGLFQETAILQSHQVGRGFDWLERRGEVWVIVQTLVEIERLPQWSAQVEVQSWVSELGRMLSRREFLLDDERGPCARASTQWAYLDTRTRRVARMPDEHRQAYPLDPAQAVAKPFPRPIKVTHPAWVEDRVVGAADIDSNGHVNNRRSLGFLLRALPAHGQSLRALKVRYTREVREGERLQVRIAPLGPGRFAHEAVLEATGERLVSAETTFV